MQNLVLIENTMEAIYIITQKEAITFRTAVEGGKNVEKGENAFNKNMTRLHTHEHPQKPWREQLIYY